MPVSQTVEMPEIQQKGFTFGWGGEVCVLMQQRAIEVDDE